MVLLENSAFLLQLSQLYANSQSTSVYVTVKRHVRKPIANSESFFALYRASTAKTKISTIVGPNQSASFHALFTQVNEASMTGLTKKVRSKKS